MTKDEVLSVKDVVHKLQLSLLEGIKHENQLSAAGSLISRSDYQDVVTERTIANMCGYPLCSNSLPSERPWKGHYRISLKEHKVYDLRETYTYCSSTCLINSRAYAASLQEERSSTLNPTKLNEVLKLFDGLSLDSAVNMGKNGDLGFSELKIQEKTDTQAGEVSLEEWIGPSNAIDGYVPRRDQNLGAQKSNNRKKGGRQGQVESKNRHAQPKKTDILSSDINFASTIITQDEHGISKTVPSTKAKVTNGKGSINDVNHQGSPMQRPAVPSENIQETRSKKFNKHKNVTATDGQVSILKDTAGPSQSDAVGGLHLGKGSASGNNIMKSSLKTSESKKATRSVAWADEKTDDDWQNLSELKELKYNEEAVVATHSTDEELGEESNRFASAGPSQSDAVGGLRLGKESAYGNNIRKSSLKTSESKKATRSVTWADEKTDGDRQNLSELKELKDNEEAVVESHSADEELGEDSYRFASAEACARALTDAAEAVASGKADVSDAVSEAGVIILPPPHGGDEAKSEEDGDAADTDQPSLKWPPKPGFSNADLFDSEDSWYDSPPEGFNLALSPFSTMFMALFAWISSSSLAYTYGKEESFHEEYLSVNGREYPRKAVMPDGRSSEIKQTLAGCLSRALPGLVAGLRLPIPISTLEQGMGRLLDTMSFIDPLPALRIKQWQVIVLLFLDALSVSRIPALTPYLMDRRILLPKVIEGADITAEEYEIMKDLLIPLGRVPQFSTQSGA